MKSVIGAEALTYPPGINTWVMRRVTLSEIWKARTWFVQRVRGAYGVAKSARRALDVAVFVDLMKNNQDEKQKKHQRRTRGGPHETEGGRGLLM